MWKLVTLAAAVLWLAGCSNDNQIIIRNDALETITFSFRATEYDVPPNSTAPPIKDIPNGTYAVSLGIIIPPGATSSSISPSSGQLTFQKKSTKISASFGSTLINGVYAVTWNYSSTDPVASLIGP